MNGANIQFPQRGHSAPDNDPLVFIISLFVQIVKVQGHSRAVFDNLFLHLHIKKPPVFVDRGPVLTVIQDYSWPASFL